MRQTFTTTMPDRVGAFLKASRCIAGAGANITRVSYNKAVDMHILFIEVEGAGNIRRMYPEATTVFITPPSLEELEHRLRGRGTESEEAIQGRLARAREEMAQAGDYTASLVNREVDDCARQLYDLIRARQEG